MSGSFFLDTNILVYSFDANAPAKRDRARQLITSALEGAGMISFQVVQEFLNLALRKFENPMSPDQANAYLEGVLIPLCRIHSDPDLYKEALAVKIRWGFSFYDSLIVAAARGGGCQVLYSEDLQHGQNIGGLAVVNPFLGTSE